MVETLFPFPIDFASKDLLLGGAEAYEALAHEYDDASHETTRELERLSALGLWRSGTAEILRRTDGLVVELGVGTGALTKEYLGSCFGGEALLTDASPGMLSVARENLSGATPNGSIEFQVADVNEALVAVSEPAAIVSGLGDPYLSEGVLREMVRASHRRTAIFISIPTYTWAKRERRERLEIPIEMTRFRSRSGAVHLSRSIVLDPEDLSVMARRAGIRVRAAGAAYSDTWRGENPPGVTWLLGSPAL